MENTDFVIEHIDEEVKVIADNPSSVTNYPANTDFFIENIDANVISIAHSLNIEASEVDFRPANTDFFVLNIDNNVIKVAQSLGLEPSIVTLRPANTDFFIENIDANLILVAEYYDLDPSRVVVRPANTDMFIENIDRNVTLIKSKTNVVTASGSFININVPDGGTMQLKQIYGNATQDGTPTPDSPAPISTVTGEQVVKVVGKNLFSGFTTLATGSTFADGTLTMTTSATNTSNDFVVQGSTAYYLNFDTPNQTRIYIREYDGAGNMLVNTTKYVPYGFTTNANTKIVRVYFAPSTSETFPVTVKDIQLELGSTATSYEPYQGQEFSIDLGSIELAKIGTYQDRIYKEDSKWYIEKQVGKVVLDGSDDEVFYSNTYNNYYRILYPTDDSQDYSSTYRVTTGILSSHFTPSSADGYGKMFAFKDSVRGNCIYFFPTADITTMAGWRNWLAGSPVTLFYLLATPTTTEITDETLLSQLNFVANIYEGINNISFIGTGAQGVIEVVINKN